MSKGNDLIEHPPVVAWIITDKNGFRSITQSPITAEGMMRLGHDVISLVRMSDYAALGAHLSEALAEAEKKGAEDWQPIETAPKDGTLILAAILFKGLYFQAVVFWEGAWVDESQGSIYPTPTHWRPLPAPPRDLSQGGQP